MIRECSHPHTRRRRKYVVSTSHIFILKTEMGANSLQESMNANRLGETDSDSAHLKAFLLFNRSHGQLTVRFCRMRY